MTIISILANMTMIPMVTVMTVVIIITATATHEPCYESVPTSYGVPVIQLLGLLELQ